MDTEAEAVAADDDSDQCRLRPLSLGSDPVFDARAQHRAAPARTTECNLLLRAHSMEMRPGLQENRSWVISTAGGVLRGRADVRRKLRLWISWHVLAIFTA